MTYSRRDLCLLVTALAASPGVAAQKTALPSKVFPYEEMPVRKTSGNESRPILSGELHNGCSWKSTRPGSRPGQCRTRRITTCTRRCSWSGREPSR